MLSLSTPLVKGKLSPAQTFDFSTDMTAVAEGGKIHFVPEKSNMKDYTWYFGDGGYSKEVSPYHYYYHTNNAAFTLRLEVKNSLGCILSTTKNDYITMNTDAKGSYAQIMGKRYYFDEQAVTSVEIAALEASANCKVLDIVIFPNPVVSGNFNISHIECVERVEIYDLAMNLLVNREATNNISVSSLPTGMYLVALKLVDGGLKVGKIIVQ